MKELIASLLLFIAAETDYNVDLPYPQIAFLPQAELEKKYLGDVDVDSSTTLWAFYDTHTDTIYLQDQWKIYDPWAKSVLLHELIHYVQDQNEAQFACIREMEKEAWPLQKNILCSITG